MRQENIKLALSLSLILSIVGLLSSNVINQRITRFVFEKGIMKKDAILKKSGGTANVLALSSSKKMSLVRCLL